MISKTILVKNSLNQPAGFTYPKRAKNLVKHHRAVWLNPETIQLLDLQKGASSEMSIKEALFAVINEMSETQVRALLVFLDTFKNNPPEVSLPDVPVPDAKNSVRTEMMKTLQEQMNNLDYSSPNAENVLKELKDMLNMLLRV